MGTKHTPMPWETSDAHGPIEGGTCVKAVADNMMIAACTGYYGRQGGIDNAAFIVRACNSHDQLVSALTACLKRLVADCADKSCVEIMEARAALTAAGVA